MQADAEGNIYTAEFEWNATEGDDAYTQQTTVLHKYDASGTELMAQDITDIMQQDENNLCGQHVPGRSGQILYQL